MPLQQSFTTEKDTIDRKSMINPFVCNGPDHSDLIALMLMQWLTIPHILSWYLNYDWMCLLWNYSVKLLTSLWFEPLCHVVRHSGLVVDLEPSATTFPLLSIFPTTSLFLFPSSSHREQISFSAHLNRPSVLSHWLRTMLNVFTRTDV